MSPDEIKTRRSELEAEFNSLQAQKTTKESEIATITENMLQLQGAHRELGLLLENKTPDTIVAEPAKPEVKSGK